MRIGAVEHSKVFVGATLPGFHAHNLVSNYKGFFEIAVALNDLDAATHVVLGKDVFPDLLLVLLNERIGRIDNVLRGAVVAFQFECFQTWETLLEVENVVDARTTE